MNQPKTEMRCLPRIFFAIAIAAVVTRDACGQEPMLPVPEIPAVDPGLINQDLGSEIFQPGLILPEGMAEPQTEPQLIPPTPQIASDVSTPFNQPTSSLSGNSNLLLSTKVMGTPTLSWFGYSTPVRVGFFGGESYAEPAPFLSLEMLKPFSQSKFEGGGEALNYLDLRGGMSLNGGFLGNFGLGTRTYVPEWDVIADANIWYDLDSTRGRVFQQIAAGGQVQSQSFLLRGHYYVPIGGTEEIIEYTELSESFVFLGNNLAIERYRVEEQAFEGFDVEAGVLLPLGNQMARWFVGYYDFSAADIDQLSSYTTTLSYDPMPQLSLAFQVTFEDESDDLGYMFSAVYDFYSGPHDPQETIRHRMGESIRRNRHIVSRRPTLYDPELARDENGDLINIIHVSSGGNSNGTFESPYANLSQAATDAAATPGSIIFAHADSVFDGQGIVLPTNTRFLGEGIDHTVVTNEDQFGEIVLPRATEGTALPIIRNSPASRAAVTLASTTEVNGIQIENSGAAAIYAAGPVTDASLLNTSVIGGVTGLYLDSPTGNIVFDQLAFANTTGSAVRIQSGAAGATTTFRNGLTISNAGLYGLHLRQNAEGSQVNFEGNVDVDGAANHGIFFDDNSNGAGAAFTGPVTVQNVGGSGVFASNLDTTTNSASAIQFGDLTINNVGQSGVVSNLNSSTVSINQLSLTNWQNSAVIVNGSNGDFSIGSPLSLNNVNGSLQPTINISNSSGGISFSDVTIEDTARTVVGQPTVFLFQNETSVDEITFNSLNVTSNNGTAVHAQDSGTDVSKLVIRSGTISAVGSPALFLEQLSTDVTFQSVSTSNTPIGVILRNVGSGNAFHERFQITGDSSTPGSGGTITNVQTGVLIEGTQDVQLHLMNIDSSAVGVSVAATGFDQPEALTLNQLVLTDAGGSPNWVGISSNWGAGAHFADANVITGNTISGSGVGQRGIVLSSNQSNPAVDYTIGGNTISLTGAISDGFRVTANGVTPLQTNNVGGVNLSGALNNVVNVTQTPFLSSSFNGASVTGSILVNGIASP